MSEPIIRMEGIKKIYPDGTVALRGVTFEVLPGEIHGLLGENGAGKTTLMSILYGIVPLTSGRIFIKGRQVRVTSPNDAMRLGIGMVHQHFMLVPVFTALDNIILGAEPRKKGFLIDRKEAERRVMELMERVALKVDLDAPVETLPVGVRQRIEILKMLYREADILILDEPTAVLTPIEVEELFSFLRRIREEGKTVIFITHKLKEVKAITDRVTVLRKGLVVGVRRTRDVSMEELATMMIGRKLTGVEKSEEVSPREDYLRIKDLWVRNDRGGYAVKGVSFSVRSGEIFGIAGVEGNGQSELVEAICGLRPPEKGDVYIRSKRVIGLNPMELYALGLGHIPEDRHKWGIILEFSLKENAILGVHRSKRFVSRYGMLDEPRIREWTESIIKNFTVEAPGSDFPAKSLSGGNQQKLIVGRELSKEPSVVIASQPTRGLDVAATEYIRKILIRMRNKGKAVLLVSADLDEVLSLSDRVAVMYEGEFMGLVHPSEINRERIGLMMGGLRLEAIS